MATRPALALPHSARRVRALWVRALLVSALRVPALLVPGLWALPAAARAPAAAASVQSLALEVRFACPRPITTELAVEEGTRAVMEVPRGCRGAGEKLLLELGCGRKVCWGFLHHDGQQVARLRGPRARIRVREVARALPASLRAPLRSLRVRVQEETAVGAAESPRQESPMEVHVVHAEGTTHSRLASGEARVVRWSSPRGEVALALHVQRTGPQAAHLTVVSDKGRTVLNGAFPLGAQHEVSCEDAGLDCSGRVRFTLQEAGAH